MMNVIDIDGVALKVYHNNNHHPGKPTLVFLHDSLGCIALWRNFPEELGTATGCNVLVYDRQGYGQSAPFGNEARDNHYLEREADVLEQVLQHYNINNAILFGHSDGGSIALIVAAKHPARIKGVITEGAHIFVEDITLAGIREAVTAYETTNLPERLQKYHGNKTDAVFKAWAHTWLTDAYRNWNIEHFLPQIHCPVLVIQGEADEYGSIAQVQGITNRVSGTAQQLMIPNTGHNPHKEAQSVVLEHCTDFIANSVNHTA